MPYPPGESECPPPPENGVEAGGGAGGGGATEAPECIQKPCAAAMLGDVAFTTVSGRDERTQKDFYPGENIYGPFEAGFGAQQENIIAGLGCSDPSLGYVDGGIDTYTAEQVVAHGCGIQLPREENGQYVSLLDECGGHTQEYHFHERLGCLYDALEGSRHSSQVGEALDGLFLYGKWEHYGAAGTERYQVLPELDACGGHFGPTPEYPQGEAYHYHVQDRAPFTIGCYCPANTADGGYKQVSVEECRSVGSCRA
jgi:hypothetical protein